MKEARWKQLHARFLEDLNLPAEEGEDSETYFTRVNRKLDVIEMSLAVKELKERLEAVESVVREDAPFGEPVSAERIMEAVRGE